MRNLFRLFIVFTVPPVAIIAYSKKTKPILIIAQEVAIFMIIFSAFSLFNSLKIEQLIPIVLAYSVLPVLFNQTLKDLDNEKGGYYFALISLAGMLFFFVSFVLIAAMAENVAGIGNNTETTSILFCYIFYGILNYYEARTALHNKEALSKTKQYLLYIALTAIISMTLLLAYSLLMEMSNFE